MRKFSHYYWGGYWLLNVWIIGWMIYTTYSTIHAGKLLSFIFITIMFIIFTILGNIAARYQYNKITKEKKIEMKDPNLKE